MNRNRLATLLVLTAALNFYGCGGAAEKPNGERIAASATPSVNAASPTPSTGGDAPVAATADTAPAPTVAAGGDAARPAVSPVSGKRDTGNAAPAKAPTPQIGSGGNDFFLFTQARAAINNDAELRAANLIVEVKEGVVTLSGTVANAALKSKAEELVRSARPKDVRNQLRVSAGR